MRLIEKLGLAAVLVALLLLITCTATPPRPESPLPELIQITALPTARAERPTVIVVTPEPGTSVPDPKFFLIVTVVDAALDPLPAMITLEFPTTGGVREVGPAPQQLFPIPIDGEERFIVKADAEGYQPVQQEFRVSLTADTDYELVLVLQPVPTLTLSAPEV